MDNDEAMSKINFELHLFYNAISCKLKRGRFNCFYVSLVFAIGIVVTLPSNGISNYIHIYQIIFNIIFRFTYLRKIDQIYDRIPE